LVRRIPICSYYRQAWTNRVIFFVFGAEMIEWNGREYRCPVEVAMDVLRGKWKCLMLWHLHDGAKRYKELERIV
jgi:hypothetical protein